MPFEIVRNDITRMEVDAIVNSANPLVMVGRGTDSRIHQVAGPELFGARLRIGEIAPGQAAITPGFRLPARYVIHTAGPVWQGGDHGEEALLRSCYDRSLALALDHGCASIAFPLIATHNYGFPRDKALQIAIGAFSDFLLEHEMGIYLVVFDRKAFALSEKLFRGIASYIDDHYVDLWEATAGDRQRRTMPAPMAASVPMGVSLPEFLRQEDAGFTETLLKLIDKTGKKDAEIYKKANLSKQHFSKIRNNPHYRPSKQTAIALALALELNLDQTKDLIGRAGYALTNSSKFDLIIRYFIERGQYNVVEINMALYEFDQSLLGG